METKRKFTPKSAFGATPKKEIAKTLKNPSYSGKTLRDKEGNIERERGFYHD